MRKLPLLLACLCLISAATPAFAYIGPGAGITMLGALWGVIVAVALAIGAVLFYRSASSCAASSGRWRPRSGRRRSPATGRRRTRRVERRPDRPPLPAARRPRPSPGGVHAAAGPPHPLRRFQRRRHDAGLPPRLQPGRHPRPEGPDARAPGRAEGGAGRLRRDDAAEPPESRRLVPPARYVALARPAVLAAGDRAVRLARHALEPARAAARHGGSPRLLARRRRALGWSAGTLVDTRGRGCLRWPHPDAPATITDTTGVVYEGLGARPAVSALRKRAWWNWLLGSPGGYLPDQAALDEVRFELPQRQVLAVGPGWARGFELSYFATVMVVSLAIKILFRIWQALLSPRSRTPLPEKAAAPAMDMPGWLDRLGGLIDRRRASGSGWATSRAAFSRMSSTRSGSTVRSTSPASPARAPPSSRAPGRARRRDPPLPGLPACCTRRCSGTGLRADLSGRCGADRAGPQGPHPGHAGQPGGHGGGAVDALLPKTRTRAGRTQVLDHGDEQPGFERFYRDHLKKILLVRRGRRYLSKGNYNLSRLAYLRSSSRMPDSSSRSRAAWHIASLMKQHRLFDARRDTRPANTEAHAAGRPFRVRSRSPRHQSSATAPRPMSNASGGRANEVRGWARYWASLYRLRRSSRRSATRRRARPADPALRGPLRAVRGRRWPACSPTPRRFDATATELDTLASRLSAPSYYAPGFTGRSGR